MKIYYSRSIPECRWHRWATLFILCFLISGFVSAQNLKGRVVNAEGKPVSEASIQNSTTGKFTYSNELGNFVLEPINVGDVLHVRAMGFETQEIQVSSLDFLRIALKDEIVNLNEIVVNAYRSDLSFITKIDLQVWPQLTSQELLRKVPGLFIGQHAGGGKAEQMFLRGFDIDHGTDINITVDGMPVNMVSHAHGQGYADLHFLIPEIVEEIDFGKGTYYADKGDFTTAGYVGFRTKERLNKSTIGIEAGQFNTRRIIGTFNLLDSKLENHSAYVASELILTDGPFDASQNFKRINILGKYTAQVSERTKLSFTASTFTSSWDASGQIPMRAVNDGTIGWFGAIDDTEGGTTSRTNVNAMFFHEIDDKTYFKGNVFYSKYKFELFSNFTFFLDDPVNGDQIRQYEDRDIFGLNTEWGKNLFVGKTETQLRGGVGFRSDVIKDNELSHTRNRLETLEQIQFGDVNQTNLFAYGDVQFRFGKLMLNPAARVDHFQFNYYDKLEPLYTNEGTSQTIVSPKLNLVYSANNRTEYYIKSGSGFHSNDARVVLSDPSRPTLPRAFGTDLGTILKPAQRLVVNSALWYLFLEQEFVWVGDAGIVEPSGRTRRMGVDVGARYQLGQYIFLDGDVNYTFARSIDEEPGEDYIPLAPDLTAMAGISLVNWKGLNGSWRTRHLRTRPANEDNSIIADGYTISDLTLNYQTGPILVGFTLENIFNVKWKETQFATESRLQNEAQPVEEIHFTPGFPRFFRLRIAYNF
ncbi:MAG: TonB-dependent receptor plug domain-containing protein [Cyclobacteriaceae bacterium]|nr:TonB-dependent receptor plug domain-containing protein [Cyclobacteriaceae bacterium]